MIRPSKINQGLGWTEFKVKSRQETASKGGRDVSKRGKARCDQIIKSINEHLIQLNSVTMERGKERKGIRRIKKSGTSGKVPF